MPDFRASVNPSLTQGPPAATNDYTWWPTLKDYEAQVSVNEHID